MKLFKEPIQTINLGLSIFAESLKLQNIPTVQVNWNPPVGLTPEVHQLLNQLNTQEISEANTKAVSQILSSEPILVDVQSAINVVPQMKPNLFLHAGPPITWDRMCGALKGAITAAVLFEGLAETAEQVETKIRQDEILLAPCHDHDAVAGMGGIISAHRPVWVMQNKTHKNTAYCVIREGTGKALRFGVFSQHVLKNLEFVNTTIAPALRVAIQEMKGLEMNPLMKKALQMGDECHSRNIATTMILSQMITHALLSSDLNKSQIKQVQDFLLKDPQFGLTIVMPACKVIMDTIKNIPQSTIVSAMTRNGTDFAIRVSGLGEQWFTAPSPIVDGLYFPGYSKSDATPDIGDSSIMETFGLGAMAMAAAPTAGQLKISGNILNQAIALTNEMYEITSTKNNAFTIPNLDYQGIPTAIDVRKVVETGITPIVNTAIAHRISGFGMIGVGLARSPNQVFLEALKAFSI